MSKISKIMVFSLLWNAFTANVYSQSFNVANYTLFSVITFTSGTVSGTSTKYVVLCDVMVGRTNDGEVIYYIAHSNEYGNAALGFDMTESQIAQFRQIKSDGDYQLVFFTRTGTNNDNYHFVVDRILPMKEVIGFAQNELPETVSYDDCYNVVTSYLRTGRVDSEHIVLDKVNKARNDAMLAEAMRSTETERQAEQQRQQEVARREERNAARERMRILANSTVHNGYKPCFNIEGSSDATPYGEFPKIAIVGYFENVHENEYKIWPVNYNRNQRGRLTISVDTNHRNLFKEIAPRPQMGIGYKDTNTRSYICIFFLSKSPNGNYTIDDYTFYGDLVNEDETKIYAQSISQNVLEEWILQNYDR
jgi:hypothetical protein